ncbi:hypothetical protein [Buchnera aphidicola]
MINKNIMKIFKSNTTYHKNIIKIFYTLCKKKKNTLLLEFSKKKILLF